MNFDLSRRKLFALFISVLCMLNIVQMPPTNAAILNEIIPNTPLIPQKSRLLKIDTQGSTSLTHFIDPTQISVDSDNITRFVLVSLSNNNVANTTLVGISCVNQEFKIYGYILQRANNPEWIFSSAPNWQALTNWGSNPILYLLAENYLCAPIEKGFEPIRSTEQILLNLEQW